jgi:phage-related protein
VHKKRQKLRDRDIATAEERYEDIRKRLADENA